MPPRREPWWVITMDPGKMTGIAWLWQDCDAPGSVQLPWDEVGAWLDRTLDMAVQNGRMPTAIISEAFEITGQTHKKSRDGKTSLELIGVWRYLAAKYSVPFAIQQPNEALGFATNDKLRAIGWWVPGQDHARDARRHLLLHVCQKRLIDLEALLRAVE